MPGIISQLHFDRQRVQDIASVIGHYASNEFASPFRSTVPLLSLMQDRPDVFSTLLAACQIQESANLHLEYTVGAPQGTGKPSHTDIMVRAADATLAIEAKWTEPRYETVGKWLGQSKADDNRWRVMKGWLELLQPHATCRLTVDSVRDAVYQMVHRAASACRMTSKPRLAYLHFTPSPDSRAAPSDQYLADLRRLHALLGNPVDFPFRLLEVRATPTSEFAAIAGLPKASAATSESVRNAIRKGGLFEFAVQDVHAIH